LKLRIGFTVRCWNPQPKTCCLRATSFRLWNSKTPILVHFAGRCQISAPTVLPSVSCNWLQGIILHFGLMPLNSVYSQLPQLAQAHMVQSWRQISHCWNSSATQSERHTRTRWQPFQKQICHFFSAGFTRYCCAEFASA
jgi:hypothetical protein